MTEFVEVPEFSSDLKKIKKFRSIYEDLQRFTTALEVVLPDCLRGTVPISRLGEDVKVPVYKVKHFRCTSLTGKGSMRRFRIIYVYDEGKDRVTLIEIYFKNGKQNHDKERILKYFS